MTEHPDSGMVLLAVDAMRKVKRWDPVLCMSVPLTPINWFRQCPPFVVLRAGRGPGCELSDGMDGRWEHRPVDMPLRPTILADHGTVIATPNGEIETREDGERAEVYVTRPYGWRAPAPRRTVLMPATPDAAGPRSKYTQVHTFIRQAWEIPDAVKYGRESMMKDLFTDLINAKMIAVSLPVETVEFGLFPGYGKGPKFDESSSRWQMATVTLTVLARPATADKAGL